MATSPAPTVSVHVKITIKPSCTEAFLAALKPTFEATIAEPLNTFLELYRVDKEPGVFHLVENWNATAEYLMNVSIKSPATPQNSLTGTARQTDSREQFGIFE